MLVKKRKRRERVRAQCHPDRQEMSRGMCQPCYKRWLKETAPADRVPVDRSLWTPKKKQVPACHPASEYGGNGLCKHCYGQEWRRKNREKVAVASAAKHLRAKYGITPELRVAIYLAQGGSCAICLKALPPRGRRTHVDHCHETGTVRGILCNQCNWLLSKFDADPEMLVRITNHRKTVWNKPD